MGAAWGRREWLLPLLLPLLVLLCMAGAAMPDVARAASPEPVPIRIRWMLTEGDPAVQQIVARHLPELEHSVTRGNSKRVWKTLLDGEPACTADVLFRGEHAQKIYFSPTVLSLPPTVLVRPAGVGVLPKSAQGSVQLHALLARPDLLGAAVSGRYYGQLVNELIARRPPRSGLTLLDSGYGVVRAIEMLLSRRVDYVIAYTSDLDEPSVAARVNAETRPLVLPVEGAEALAQAGVACPRTPWGLAAMQRIDAALSAPDSVAGLEKIQQLYMTEADRKRHAAELQAFFRARAQPMMRPESGAAATAPAP